MIAQTYRLFIAGILISVVYFSPTGGIAAMSDKQKIFSPGDEHCLLLPSKAKVIDLTQTINTSAPAYDGKTDNFKYQTLSTVDKDGYGTGAFFIHEHSGTHMDAPIHFCTTGIPIDKISASNLVLPVVVIDVRDEVKKNPDYVLTVEKIKEFEKKNVIPVHSAVLLLTGWSTRYFNDGQYRNADKDGNMHFPGFSLEAAEYLVDNHKIASLGIDTLSIDHGPSEAFPVHKFILSQGLFMVENLTNLDQLPASGSVVVFAPLKIEGGTGSPTRVLALVPLKS